MPPSLAPWRHAGTLMSESSKVVDTFILAQQILPTPHSQETMYGRRRFDRTSIFQDASDSMRTREWALSSALEKENSCQLPYTS